jgi:hypothetical protein
VLTQERGKEASERTRAIEWREMSSSDIILAAVAAAAATVVVVSLLL